MGPAEGEIQKNFGEICGILKDSDSKSIKAQLRNQS